MRDFKYKHLYFQHKNSTYISTLYICLSVIWQALELLQDHVSILLPSILWRAKSTHERFRTGWTTRQMFMIKKISYTQTR